jgi:predicted DNA-binding transcriptional regulator AlpA
MNRFETSFLTLADLAARWQVKERWIYNNHSRLQVPTLPIGGHLRFPLTEIIEWERKHGRHW